MVERQRGGTLSIVIDRLSGPVAPMPRAAGSRFPRAWDSMFMNAGVDWWNGCGSLTESEVHDPFLRRFFARENARKLPFPHHAEAVGEAQRQFDVHVADAIEVFKLNVEDHPDSFNVHDSLGEAYMLAGNREEAIKSYKAALKIDPNFGSSLDALRRLEGNR